jgi:deoxyribonuclease V
MYLATDVHYRTDFAKVVCIAFEHWTDKEPSGVYQINVNDVPEYIPGEFYKRELPCILEVLGQTDIKKVKAIVVDGYVFLNDENKPGLGMHLYKALGEQVPVIGVAKSKFHDNTKNVEEVFRGSSEKPLYVTATGIPLQDVALHVKSMYGDHRLPHLLKYMDTLTKS